MPRPNVLLILVDQLRFPPPYETDEVRAYRERHCRAQQRLRASGVSFQHHYPMATACAPSRTSLLTGHYPSLHGVTQTDGVAKAADGEGMTWLEPDSVPTLGHWFRAAGYQTFYKGKWHISHAHLDADDGDGYLLCVDDDGVPQRENIERYLQADLLDPWGFSEWVGPEAHGLQAHSMGRVRDPFTSDETIELLERLERKGGEAPWLTVCSFLNPHDVAYFGLFGLLKGGQRYGRSEVPTIPQAPTREEDLSTKPSCQQSMVDLWPRIGAPQPFVQAHLRYYYEMQAAVDEQINRVLDALEASAAAANTIVVFSSDHGDLMGAHGGMHQKWHNAYEEALHVPFVVSSPLVAGGPRSVGLPTSHADLLPTLLGLAGLDHDALLERLRESHHEARPLVGRDLSAAIGGDGAVALQSVLFMTDDEISEGEDVVTRGSPQDITRRLRLYSSIEQPNHIETVVAEVEVDGEPHLIKFSRYHDNPQFWTVPGERDERLRGRRTVTVTEPAPDQHELYDLTLDPFEERNLAHPSQADERTRALEREMLRMLSAELERKRRTPAGGGLPGYRPPHEVP